MKTTTVEFKGKSIEIELTDSQIAKIKKEGTDYTDIKNLQDALDFNGETLEEFNRRTQFDDDVQRAGKELEVIVQAVRQGNDLGEKWYYPWFNSNRSSVGFSYRAYDCVLTTSYVGSRLCVESSEKATYLGKQFLDTYNRYINGSQLEAKDSPLIEPKTYNSFKDIEFFEDACILEGIDPKEFHETHKHLSDDAYAYEQLEVISRAINGGEVMNYDDTDEYKYYPYFHAKGSSVGFSYRACDCDRTYSGVGSRLTYKCRDRAEHAGRQFIDIYNKYIN